MVEELVFGFRRTDEHSPYPPTTKISGTQHPSYQLMMGQKALFWGSCLGSFM